MTEHVGLRVRFPPEMHAQLTAIAAENGRSLNSEILNRLSLSLEPGWIEFVQSVKDLKARKAKLADWIDQQVGDDPAKLEKIYKEMGRKR